MHRHRYLLTDVLKEELGFDGLIVSDYNAINHIGGDFTSTLAECLEAGIDMVMTAGGLIGEISGDVHYAKQIEACLTTVEDGRLSMKRLNDAVKRILRVRTHGLTRQSQRAQRLEPQVPTDRLTPSACWYVPLYVSPSGQDRSWIDPTGGWCPPPSTSHT